MSENMETGRLCVRCNEFKPRIAYGWRFNVCPECVSEAPKTQWRKCSRCKLHKADWQTTSYYCRECQAAYTRAWRAKAKAAGLAVSSVKTCSKCGAVEAMPPECSRCRSCRNEYQRKWKATHPDWAKLPPGPPQPVTGREPLETCSSCRSRRPYNRKEFVRGNICTRCYSLYKEKANKNQKAKWAEWRENQTPVDCRVCYETKPYGVGWNGRRCRECQAVYAAKAYAETKANPQHLRRRKEQQEQARRRRQLKAAQDADSGSASGSSGGQDGKGPETPENAPVVAPQLP